jgi:hypothetical protein
MEIVYRTVNGREAVAKEIRRAPGGGVLVEHEDGSYRWIPDHWIIETVE